MAKFPFPRRGEVWMVSPDPTRGHEVRNTRPTVVVIADIYIEEN